MVLTDARGLLGTAPTGGADSVRRSGETGSEAVRQRSREFSIRKTSCRGVTSGRQIHESSTHVDGRENPARLFDKETLFC